MTSILRSSWIGVGLACLVACEEGGTSQPDANVQRCNPTAPFGRITSLAALSTGANEEQPKLSADELTLYFSRDDTNNAYDIHQATRPSKTAAFGAATLVASVNTAGEDRYPHVTADGLTMFATTKATRDGLFRVSRATRASQGAAFGPLQDVPGVNGTTNDSDPYILANGNVLYFTSDRSGAYALYRSAQTGGQFSDPQLVAGAMLDTVYREIAPVVSEDELSLYFASSRPNLPGGGEVDIYQATRASTQEPFGAPVALTQLNTIRDELPSWISPDGCELYLTRFDPTLMLELAVSVRGF